MKGRRRKKDFLPTAHLGFFMADEMIESTESNTDLTHFTDLSSPERMKRILPSSDQTFSTPSSLLRSLRVLWLAVVRSSTTTKRLKPAVLSGSVGEGVFSFLACRMASLCWGLANLMLMGEGEPDSEDPGFPTQ
jgi:hypothetical protein